MTASTSFSSYCEEQVLHRLSLGDESALAAIYRQYWKTLFTQAFSIIRDKMVCEDIVQDIFLQLWRKKSTLRVTSSLGHYLQAATRYQVFHYIRRTPGREDLFDNIGERISGDRCDQRVYEKELDGQVSEIISLLPEKCRTIYKLSREEFLPHREIAQRLHISIKTVENQITIALRRLRLSLKDAVLLLFFLN